MYNLFCNTGNQGGGTAVIVRQAWGPNSGSSETPQTSQDYGIERFKGTWQRYGVERFKGTWQRYGVERFKGNTQLVPHYA